VVSFAIANQNILVVGASSGIGREISLNCCVMKAKVTSIARRVDMLKKLDDEISQVKGQHQFVQLDITNEEHASGWIKSASPFDSVVMSVGVIEYLPSQFANKDRLGRVHDLNYVSTAAFINALVKQKKIKPGGSIVLVSSISSQMGIRATGAYAASKAALNAYSRVLAAELAPQKIRVNYLSPGTVKTDAFLKHDSVDEKLIEDLEKKYPLGLGQAEDVAGAALFLISPASKWITGANIVIDGGYTLGG
jgi:NAD(P)-dependent dehydrogenase (short-subunit alcohol dehydrogenase family)